MKRNLRRTLKPQQKKREEQCNSPHFPIESLPIGMFRIPNQRIRAQHDHDFTEIAIIESGHGVHLFDNISLPVIAGDVFIINPDHPHAWLKTQDMAVTNIMISESNSLPMLNDLKNHPGYPALFTYEPNLLAQQKGRGRLKLNVAQLNEVLRISHRLGYALKSKKKLYPSETMATLQLLSLIGLLCDAYIDTPNRAQKTVLRVGKAIQEINMNITNPPNTNKLADDMNISTSTFYRLFRQATGLTPAEYLNDRRIESACKLLASTDYNITEIAFKVGFQDSNYFSRSFRKLKDITPLKFRKMNSLW